ncbi:mannosyltransferase putative-domain-containing protein [Cladochytrium replicatum]|nr:mannosyltransferase putative-domain-containing protein [Cladochytrium replicatum]
MYEELYKHANTILDKTWEAGKYGDAGPHLRTYSQLYTLVFDRPELHIRLARSPRFAAAGYIVNQLEQKLFPWIKKKYHSLNELRSTWKGKGIVLTSGKWHFPLALHAILCLRNVLNVTLPIEVFHSGPGDTETKFSKALERIPNVRAVDVNTIFEESQAGLGGWHVKPFSMLASSFEEMVFLDADVLFLQDPATLFSYKGYKNLGTVFFYDRSIGHGRYETHEWFEGWMKDPTPIARQSRFLQHNTIHEMESGVVVFDKHRALMQLLGVCWMNTREQREVAMKKVHGDKETFWMVAELMRLPYYWVPGYGGTIGYKNKTDGYICGGLYHADENGRPLWWNGGVLMNKHYHRDEYIEFTHWAYDKTTEVTWKWETEHTPFCLMPKNPETEIGILDIRERDVTSKFLEHYKYIQDRGMDRLDEIMKHFGY